MSKETPSIATSGDAYLHRWNGQYDKSAPAHNEVVKLPVDWLKVKGFVSGILIPVCISTCKPEIIIWLQIISDACLHIRESHFRITDIYKSDRQ